MVKCYDFNKILIGSISDSDASTNAILTPVLFNDKTYKK